ncbi:hypothetical protein V8C40DRAFT_237745 [Trichoderma camerunense]
MSASANEAFDGAFRRFLESLSEAERTRYAPVASPKDLLDGIKKLDFLSHNHQRTKLGRVLKCIEAFNTRLTPYFAVVDTSVSSNPQYAAIVWGLLKFVIQLAGNFTTFFDRLIKVIGKISDAFPMYEDIVRVSQGHKSSRLRAHLEEVYSDILQFFQHVTRIFARADGRFKRRPAVICEIIWTPFDTRFEKLLGQLNDHEKFVQSELLLLQAIATNDATAAAVHERDLAAKERANAEKARARVDEISKQTDEIKRFINEEKKDLNFSKVHRWINPPNYVDVLEKAQSVREEGTCTWLCTHEVFCKWRETDAHEQISKSTNDLGTRALWVNGIPGAGKTILASYVVQELLQLESADTLYCYYFFSSDSSNFGATGTAAAYRSILSQILHRKRNDENILDKFIFARDQSTGQLEASFSELSDLIQICSKELKDLTIIFDGIDECSEINELFGTIRKLMKLCPIKVLFFSRPGVSELQDEVQVSQRIDMDRFATSEDIRIYLRASLESLVSRGRLHITDTSDLQERLVRGANGMFLWASLMISLLWSPMLTSESRLTIIEQVVRPEGIEQLYDRILKVIAQSKRLEKSVARVVFCWLTYSRGSVSLRLLHDVLRNDNLRGNRGPQDNLQFVGEARSLSQFRENLQAVCGSLLDFIEPTNKLENFDIGIFTTVRFVHLSVKDYFTSFDSPSSEDYLECVSGRTQGNILLAQTCLRSLRLMPEQHSPSSKELNTYATLHWTGHLEDMSTHDLDGNLEIRAYLHKDFPGLQAALLDFLRDSFSITSWLHSLYSIHGHGDLIARLCSLDRWVCWLRRTQAIMAGPAQSLEVLIALASRFSDDLRHLEEIWGSKLQNSPRILWDEVSAFMKSDFIHSTSNTKVKLLRPEALEDKLQSSRALCDISASSPDGSLCFVLSIWPSRDYESRWQTVGGQKSLELWRDVCSGWIARYRIWNVSTKESLGEISIPLDQGEVWLQMRQSLYEQSYGEWKTAFPTAISPDGKLVTILRTLFAFDKPHGCSQLQWQEVLIQGDFGKEHSTKWTNELTPFDPNHRRIKGKPLQFLYRNRYTYEFIFSSDSRYLAFIDNMRGESFTMYEAHLAIFETGIQGKIRADQIASRTFGYNFQMNKLTVCFHPYQDLVALYTGGRVQLWNFRTEYWWATPNKIGESFISSPPQIDSLKISACGRYVIANQPGGPTVFEIPTFSPAKDPGEKQSLEQQFLHTADFNSNNHDNDNDTIATRCMLGNTDVSHFGLRHGQVLHNECIVNAKDGIVASVVRVLSGDTPALQLIPATEGLESQTVELMSLPKSLQLKHTAPVILAPSDRDTNIKVVLNSTLHSEYSLTEQHTGVVPAIVERDIKSLKLSTLGFTHDCLSTPGTEVPRLKIQGKDLSSHSQSEIRDSNLPPLDTDPESHCHVSKVNDDDDFPPAKRQRVTGTGTWKYPGKSLDIDLISPW